MNVDKVWIGTDNGPKEVKAIFSNNNGSIKADSILYGNKENNIVPFWPIPYSITYSSEFNFVDGPGQDYLDLNPKKGIPNHSVIIYSVFPDPTGNDGPYDPGNIQLTVRKQDDKEKITQAPLTCVRYEEAAATIFSSTFIMPNFDIFIDLEE